MANQKITVEVDVQSNTAKETNQAERLGAALKDAAASAQRIKVPAGATTGTAPATGVGAIMARSQPVGAQAVMQYGQQRGAAGATGAEARDFARQSEGLGGLVRLYATYAANIYAAGAAFRALSDAMDTSNMVRGLDQLGAVGGVALGSLSKQLVATTGGAISLREAMSATVKVTAAGLGQQNVLRLGQVATKASQALGVDMSDAISRLSRGITKLEPELLDELGIFTKIEPAVEKYAISVGKSAGQLTDFERRQAFANAVLAEGEKKFSAIKIDANPYNKLAASLTNIAQQGLELVNKVLGPLVDLLSSNPTALIAGLAAIGTTLIKQAIPAVGFLRQNIQKANEEANARAASRAKDSIKLQEELNKKSLELIEERANKEIQALDDAETKFKQLKEKGVASKSVGKVLKTESVTDISTKQITTIEDEALKARKKGLIEQAKVYDDLAVAIRNGKKAEEDYLRVQTDAEKQLQKDINSRRTIIGLNKALADSAEKSSFKDQIVSNAAYTGSMIGPINAIKLMIAQIKAGEISLNKFSVAMLIARGSLAAFAGAAATIGAALNIAFAAITAVIGVGAILVSLFTNTSKESAATSEAIDQLTESTKNLSNTIDVINKKPYLEQFTAESLSARTNALDTFSTAIQKANEASSKELQSMNWLDKGVDIVKMIWGGDVQSKLNKEISYGLAKVFTDTQTSNSVAGKAAKQTIGKLLDIKETDLTDFKTINSALNKLSGTEAAYVISQINAEIDNLGKISKKSSDPLLGLEESFKKVTEARQKFISESVPKDTFTDFGRGLISSSFELESALKNPEARLQSIRKVFDEIKNIGGVPQDLLFGLQDAAKTAEKMQVLNASLNNTSSEIDKLISKRDALEKTSQEFSVRVNYDKATKAREEIDAINKQIDNLEKSKEIDLKVLVRLDTDLQAYNNTIKEAQIKVFETGSQVVANRLNVEFAKAGATISKAIAGVLPDTEEGIALRAKADVALINAQIQQIKAIDEQIKAQVENTIALKEKSLAEKTAELRLIGKDQPDTAAVIGKEISALTGEINSFKATLKPGGSFVELSKKRTQDLRTLGESTVSLEALRLSESRAANLSKIQQLTAEIFQIQTQATTSIDDARLKITAKRLQDEEKSIALDKARLVSSKELTSDLSEQGAILRQNIERREAELKTQADLLEIDLKIEKARRFKDTFPKAKAQFEQEKTRLVALQEEEAFNKRLLDAKELITIRAKNQTKAENDRFVIETNSYNLQTQILDSKQKFLDLQKQQGILTDKDYIIQKNSLDVLQASLNYNKEIAAAKRDQNLALIEQKAAEDRLQKDIEARRAQDLSAGPVQNFQLFTESELQGKKLITDEVNRINNAYRDSTTLNQLTYNNTLSQLEVQKQLSLQQEEFNYKLNTTKGIGESLADVFGKVGSAIGNAAVALTELKRTQELNNASIGFYDKKLREINDTIDESQRKGETVDPNLFKDKVTAQENYNQAVKKAQKDEISGNIKVLSSVKTMFKEKSAGYKAISALEKVMHVSKLAMDAAEMASNFSKTTQTVINAGMNVAAYIAEAGAKGLSAITGAATAPFPMGFVAGAAMAAFIGSILGKSFKGTNKPSGFVPTAAQRQETQGTAMSWDLKQAYGSEGKKIQTREGVFGDTSAKSESISKSLEIIATNSVDGLQYDNKLLRAFEKLSSAMEKVATSLYTVKGITTGTGFGTQEGTKSSGASWFFGKSVTKEITDAGIQLKGTFLELAKSTGGVTQQFETVTTTTKKGGFLGIGGRTNISVSTATKDLDPKTQQAVNDAFAQGYETLLTLGVKAGLNQQTIDDVLSKVDVNELASLRGLTGEALQTQISAVFGAILDDASLAVFKTLDFNAYRKFGEGMLQTAVRVVDTNEKLNQSLDNLNTTDSKFPKLGFEASESLAKLFGGVDKAVTAFQNYENSVLTEEQRAAKKRSNLTQGLIKLNLTEIKSRQDLVDKVEQLARSGQQNTETFKKLIDLAPQFVEVVDQLQKKLQDQYDSLKNVRDTIKDLLKNLKDFKDQLLLGAQSYLTPGEQYLKAKQDFETTYAQARLGDKQAIQDLSKAGSTLADKSRLMFASSEQYTTDVNSIIAAVDDITATQTKNLTDAETALKLARDQYTELEKITDNTYITAESVSALVANLKAAQQDRSNIATAPVVAQPSAQTASSYTAITSSYTAAKSPVAVQDLLTPMFYDWIDSISGIGGGYASGATYLARDQVAQVHEGERIVPAADNRQLMRMVSSYSTNGGELYQEVCRLTKQVETLTQVVADGAIMNAQATDRNTEQIANTIQQTGETTVYSQKLQNRASIV